MRGDAPIVAIADSPHGDAIVLLDRALDVADFWRVADRAACAGGRALILVDLAAFDLRAPVVTRVDLVEHLIDALAERGWSDITIASSPDSSSTWAENRGVAVLADLVGYKYETPRGTAYDVQDLAEDLADADFPRGSVLAGMQLARCWLDADLRVVFAKCKTDAREMFALCASSLLSAFPLADKDYYYRLRLDPAAVLCELTRRAPPHFAIVDACGAAHGSGGQHAPEAIATHAVIAGADFLAVDCATATKMGADPAASPLVAGLMATLGKPELSRIEGDCRAFADFRLPDPLVVESTRVRDRSLALSRLVAPWIQSLDARVFPHKNPLDAKINAAVAPRLAKLDNDLAGKAWLIYFNALLAAIDRLLNAWHVVANKDAVMRRVAGISPETLACAEADYRAMEHELEDLEGWLNAQAGRERPLRWRYLDRAVVFDYQREFPVPFDEFTRRVDISRTIQFMNDYIGGTLLPVECDAAGRPVRQVERNLYLPQPNYLAWWDGREIDVSKIESVHYAASRQRMFWKTIKSENASAIFDDGIVTFEAVAAGTRVTIFGRQLFVLPPFFEQARLDLYPEIKNHLVTHAYETFFARTFANFEALVEGRDIAIGSNWHAAATPHDSAERPIDALIEITKRFIDATTPLIQSLRNSAMLPGMAGGQSGARRVVDADGFAHFKADTPAAPALAAETPANPLVSWLNDFYHGYVEALSHDFAVSIDAQRGSHANEQVS